MPGKGLVAAKGRMSRNIDYVDPFLGCEASNLPAPGGIAAAWFLPKAQSGNTHPGACYPLGMVSACAYSGAYPTGYGVNKDSYEGRPSRLFDRYTATGFTHFQHSGVGYIGRFYNYVRAIPFAGGSPDIGGRWTVENESAAPGCYACRLKESGISAELTVGRRAAFHRYTFRTAGASGLALDLSCVGIICKPSHPAAAEVRLTAGTGAEGWILVNGIRLYFSIKPDFPRPVTVSLWEEGAAVPPGRRLRIAGRAESDGRSYGVCFRFKAAARDRIGCRIGFSFRNPSAARAAAASFRGRSFDAAAAEAAAAWEKVLGRVKIRTADRRLRTMFYSALYRSFIKPVDCAGECFLSDRPVKGPFFADLATMWDMYKTQLPLLLTLWPAKGGELVRSLMMTAARLHGFPNDVLLEKPPKAAGPNMQARCLAHVTIADAWIRGVRGVDWKRAVKLMAGDITGPRNRDFTRSSGALPMLSQTLDIAYASHLTARMAEAAGDRKTAALMDRQAGKWRVAYDPATGLLKDSIYYEGGKWNYSFRLHHDMADRIGFFKTTAAFTAALDRFFGYGQAPAPVPGENSTYRKDVEPGLKLSRFEGLNNEPDMEAPYAYHFAGRPDRTAEVVRTVLASRFADGRGGLPGNDDSGALSSWFAWSALGLFPVAGQDVFLIGSPVFREASLLLERGCFTIRSMNGSARNIYVQDAELNGKPLDRTFLRWREIGAGGVLTLRMGAKPAGWGRNSFLRNV